MKECLRKKSKLLFAQDMGVQPDCDGQNPASDKRSKAELTNAGTLPLFRGSHVTLWSSGML